MFAISLSYTCLEGFFKAFIEHSIPDKHSLTELTVISREIQGYLKGVVKGYPDDALKLLNNITHAVDKTRTTVLVNHTLGKRRRSGFRHASGIV